MKKSIIIFITFLAVMAFGFAAYYVSRNRKDNFVFNEHLEENAFVIDDREISMKEASYYILSVEEFVNNEAKKYNDLDPLDYWNTHFRAGDKSAFVYFAAKKEVYEVCVTDYIYYHEAEENGFKLSDEITEEVEKQAYEQFEEMTDKQHLGTGLTLEELTDLKLRERTATEYAASLIEQIDWSYTVNSPSTELSYNGEYFQKNILPNHSISIGSLWDSVKLGRITIN